MMVLLPTPGGPVSSTDGQRCGCVELNQSRLNHGTPVTLHRPYCSESRKEKREECIGIMLKTSRKDRVEKVRFWGNHRRWHNVTYEAMCFPWLYIEYIIIVSYSDALTFLTHRQARLASTVAAPSKLGSREQTL